MNLAFISEWFSVDCCENPHHRLILIPHYIDGVNPLRSVVDYRSTAAVSLNARMSTIGRPDNVTACLAISNLLLFGI
ncbi:hypothetical protein J6590_022447 [Homalodisca vitripennis]|nr:hypothetical protein J6590_022447 [Homalodisca vitripennis]